MRNVDLGPGVISFKVSAPSPLPFDGSQPPWGGGLYLIGINQRPGGLRLKFGANSKLKGRGDGGEEDGWRRGLIKGRGTRVLDYE